jgi:hypothetical protein
VPGIGYNKGIPGNPIGSGAFPVHGIFSQDLQFFNLKKKETPLTPMRKTGLLFRLKPKCYIFSTF